MLLQVYHILTLCFIVFPVFHQDYRYLWKFYVLLFISAMTSFLLYFGVCSVLILQTLLPVCGVIFWMLVKLVWGNIYVEFGVQLFSSLLSCTVTGSLINHFDKYLFRGWYLKTSSVVLSKYRGQLSSSEVFSSNIALTSRCQTRHFV